MTKNKTETNKEAENILPEKQHNFNFRLEERRDRNNSIGQLECDNREKNTGIETVRLSHHTNPYLFFSLWGVGVYGSAFWGFFWLSEHPTFYAHLYAINIACFIVMAFDKSFARAGSQRVPESLLYCLSALGGTIGVLLAAKVFRHKTRKAKFQLILGVILVLQIVALTTFMQQL